MANFPIPEEPQYKREIRKLEKTDPAHAELFNQIFQALIENIEYVKKLGIENLDQLLTGMSRMIVKRKLTIPKDGWDVGAEEGEEGIVYLDLPQEDITEDMVPIISIHPDSMEEAKKCGMSTVSRTISKGVRIYAKKAPDVGLQASLTLLRASDEPSEGGSGSYILQPATKTRLGGVKIGENVSVEKDGTISVDKTELLEDAVATEEATEEMLNSIFGESI